MDDVSEELKALLDREKIRDCVARLARGEDRRDAALLRASFWPDSTFDYGVYAGGFDDYLAWVVPGSEAIPVTQHILGQTLYNVETSSVRAVPHSYLRDSHCGGGLQEQTRRPGFVAFGEASRLQSGRSANSGQQLLRVSWTGSGSAQGWSAARSRRVSFQKTFR